MAKSCQSQEMLAGLSEEKLSTWQLSTERKHVLLTNNDIEDSELWTGGYSFRCLTTLSLYLHSDAGVKCVCCCSAFCFLNDNSRYTSCRTSTSRLGILSFRIRTWVRLAVCAFFHPRQLSMTFFVSVKNQSGRLCN